MYTHKLVARRFTGSGDDAHCGRYISIATDRFEQAMLMQDAEGMAFERGGVLQRLLCFWVVPVGAAQEDTRVGETWNVFAIALDGSAIIMIKVRVGNNHMGDVF